MDLRKYPVGQIIQFMRGRPSRAAQATVRKAVKHGPPLTGERKLREIKDARFQKLEKHRCEVAKLDVPELAALVKSHLPHTFKANFTEAEYRKFQRCRGEISATLLMAIGRALKLESFEFPCQKADLDRAISDLLRERGKA